MSLRLGLWLAAGGLVILLVWFGLHEHEEAARQRARADNAEHQSSLDVGTGAIADHVATVRVEINKQTEEKASAIAAIPSDDVPADILRDWHGGLRYSAGGPDAEHPGELPATVPGAQP